MRRYGGALLVRLYGYHGARRVLILRDTLVIDVSLLCFSQQNIIDVDDSHYRPRLCRFSLFDCALLGQPFAN